MKKSSKKSKPRVRLLPIEERWEYAANLMWKTWVNLPRLLADKIGYEETSKFITSVSTSDADYDVPAGLKSQGLTKRNATTALLVGLAFNMTTMPGEKYKIIEATPKRAVAELSVCTQCLFAESYGLLDRKSKTMKIDYPGTDINWWTHLAELIKPSLKVDFEKLLCRGDDCTRIAIYDSAS